MRPKRRFLSRKRAPDELMREVSLYFEAVAGAFTEEKGTIDSRRLASESPESWPWCFTQCGKQTRTRQDDAYRINGHLTTAIRELRWGWISPVGSNAAIANLDSRCPCCATDLFEYRFLKTYFRGPWQGEGLKRRVSETRAD